VDYHKMIVAAALIAAALPAEAAPVGPDRNADGEALILVPLTLTKIDDPDFGTVITSGMSGTVAISATTGARSISGGVTGLPSDAGRRAWFGGGGSANQRVIVTVTPPTELTSAAGDMLPVLALTLDGPPTRVIDPVTRTFFFGVGGIINIEANQPEGVYQSLFDVTVDYL
jgi:hypothetical protein